MVSLQKYKIAYRLDQRDSRLPLWTKILYVCLCLCVSMFGLVTAYGAVYEDDKCSEPTSYLNGNRIFGWVVFSFSIVFGIFAVYILIRWKWVWMKDVAIPAPVKIYGQDVEDIEPGFLTSSSNKSFLSTQKAATETKIEVERALNDLDIH